MLPPFDVHDFWLTRKNVDTPQKARVALELTAAQKRVDEQQLDEDRTTSLSAFIGIAHMHWTSDIVHINWARVAPLLRAQAHVEAQRQDVNEWNP